MTSSRVLGVASKALDQIGVADLVIATISASAVFLLATFLVLAAPRAMGTTRSRATGTLAVSIALSAVSLTLTLIYDVTLASYL